MPMTPSPETIGRARQMYADGVPVKRICAECGITSSLLYYWIDGGPPSGEGRLPPIPRRNGRAPRRSIAKPRLRGDRGAIVARMWRTAEGQVRAVEQRLQSDKQEPAERERDARTL